MTRQMTFSRMRLIKSATCALSVWLLWAGKSAAQEQASRPPITGVARVEIYATDTAKAASFYEQRLGFPEASAGCAKEIAACLVVNDRQQNKLLKAPAPVPACLIGKIAFATSDAEKMRRYLIAKGYS